MKKVLLALIAIAFVVVSCDNQSNNTAKEETEETVTTTVEETITEVPLAEFEQQAGDLVGKKVALTGTVDHVCKHGGQRMFIVATGGEGRVKVTPDEHVAAFKTDLQGQNIEVVGIVEEMRIDEAYLREWEEEVLSGEDLGDDKGEGSHLGGNVEKGGAEADKSEELEKINNLRQQIAESGDDHLSFYSVLCTEYKVIDHDQE